MTAFAALVVAILVWELVASRPRRRAIELTTAQVRTQRLLLRLRALAWLAVLLAVIRRRVYRLGQPDGAVDWFTALCLSIAVGLVLLSLSLAKKARL